MGSEYPPSEKDAVFSRFYRAPSGEHRQGHGIGLSMCADIAELHNAKIVLGENCPGLRVSVIVPRLTAIDKISQSRIISQSQIKSCINPSPLSDLPQG